VASLMSFASLAAFRHILVFNCYYLYLSYVVLENKIYDDDDDYCFSWLVLYIFFRWQRGYPTEAWRW